MSKKRFMVMVGVVFVGILSISFIKFSSAQTQGARFVNVIPFSTANGNFCFFDQNTGVVFVYDKTLKSCITRVRINKLGGSASSY